jgi:hypothetical protein
MTHQLTVVTETSESSTTSKEDSYELTPSGSEDWDWICVGGHYPDYYKC